MEVSASVEQIKGQKPPETYEHMLKESIQRFLTDYRNGVTDFSCFGSIFSRLVQTMTDPPLEITWFYSAVTFRTHNCTVQDPLKQVVVVKDLFQVLVSCSASCSGLKRVALLAPVVYMLYELMSDTRCKRELDCLVEGIVSYISICCCNDTEGNDGSVPLGRCFDDLVGAWIVDKIEVDCKNADDLRVFFPLVNDEVRRGVSEGCGIGYLAGIVMCEAFLLRLCLKICLGGVELQKDMQNWVVNTIMGFQNCYFFDTLLRMLLEPVLLVTSFLSSEDEVLLRNILYDAVIMVEYSFLNPKLPENHLKNLAMRWLFVADSAIQSVRENGDQTKAISYANAFSDSRFPSQLIKWVTNQTGKEKTSRPHFSTPIALIRVPFSEWLLIVEDQGVKVFDHDITKLHAKAVLYKSRVDYEFPVYKQGVKNWDDNLFRYSDNEERVEDKVDEDQEMFDSVDTALLAATHTMNLTATEGRRKRKEERKDEGETKVKFVKVDLHENSMREKFLPFSNDDGLSSGCEVDNPVSDDNTKFMEQ